MTCIRYQCDRVRYEPESALYDHKHQIEGHGDPHAKTDSVGRYHMSVPVLMPMLVPVLMLLLMPMLMPVFIRVPVLVRVRVAMVGMIMRRGRGVVVMLFMFHRVRIPSMLESPHSPERGE
jgi:hypothetical protein